LQIFNLHQQPVLKIEDTSARIDPWASRHDKQITLFFLFALLRSLEKKACFFAIPPAHTSLADLQSISST
jgi:hypothetical protein